jgi:hypothetical protein
LQLTTTTQTTTPHRIAPYRTVSHRTTLPALHRIALHCNATQRIAPHRTIATQDPGFFEFGQHTFSRGCACATEEDGSGAHHQVGSGNIVCMGDTTKYGWLPTSQGGSDRCTDHTASSLRGNTHSRPTQTTPTTQTTQTNKPTNQSILSNNNNNAQANNKQTNKLKEKFVCCACVCLHCAVSVY